MDKPFLETALPGSMVRLKMPGSTAPDGTNAPIYLLAQVGGGWAGGQGCDPWVCAAAAAVADGASVG